MKTEKANSPRAGETPAPREFFFTIPPKGNGGFSLFYIAIAAASEADARRKFRATVGIPYEALFDSPEALRREGEKRGVFPLRLAAY